MERLRTDSGKHNAARKPPSFSQANGPDLWLQTQTARKLSGSPCAAGNAPWRASGRSPDLRLRRTWNAFPGHLAHSRQHQRKWGLSQWPVVSSSQRLQLRGSGGFSPRFPLPDGEKLYESGTQGQEIW